MVNQSASGETGDAPAAESKTAGKKAPAPKMAPDTLHIVEDGEAQNLNVFLRGNVDRKGPVVERRFLQVLSTASRRSSRTAVDARNSRRPSPIHEIR